MKLGSLCTGYGGLDLGVGAVLDVTHAWHAEIDPDASRVLAHHWPGVPNLGDLRAVDWSAVEPVDVLTAGFPCQPLSLAGRRRGTEDERWIWDGIAAAVGRMDPQPRLLVLENVPGLLTANRGHAMARVVQGLAALGYVGRYRVVSAADVGAAHRRERVFVVAWPAADPPRLGYRDTGAASGRGIQAAAVAGSTGAGELTLLPTPRVSMHHGPSRRELDEGDPRHRLETAVALLPTPRATDGTKGGPNQRGSSGDLMLPSAVMLLPTPTAQAAKHAADDRSRGTSDDRNLWSVVTREGRWGQYAPAIARWEQVIGRPAPEPTEPGRSGQPRLSPQFVEWLMGLAPGWVTDHLPRNPALRVLGNGVVPQQAAWALTTLLGGAR